MTIYLPVPGSTKSFFQLNTPLIPVSKFQLSGGHLFALSYCAVGQPSDSPEHFLHKLARTAIILNEHSQNEPHSHAVAKMVRMNPMEDF